MDCQKSQNRHEISINTTNKEEAFRQILLWGEASWWPKKSSMKFTRIGRGPIVQGTLYRQKVMLPFAPSWCSVVTNINQGVSTSRKLFEGFLDGQEEIKIVQGNNSLSAVYCLEYSIPNFVYRWLWKIFFESLHNYNIELILNNLKGYLEQ